MSSSWYYFVFVNGSKVSAKINNMLLLLLLQLFEQQQQQRCFANNIDD
jgi:hypothetical protein